MAAFEKRGNGYRAIVRRKGFPALRATFDTKEEAQRWAVLTERKLAEERQLGRHQDLAEAMKLSVGDALSLYAEQVTPDKKGEGARKTEISRINRIQQDAIGALKLADVRSRDVLAYVGRLRAAKLSPNTIRLYLAILSHLFTVARTQWSMDMLVNPVTGVRKPKLPRGRERRLAIGEESDLIEATLDINPELANIVILALETAARRGEIMGIQWCDVDLTKHTVTLRDTKNGEAIRIAPLSERAEAVFTRQKAKLPAPLKEKDKRKSVWASYQTGAGMYKSYTRATERIGSDGLTFHDLRHEATSRLFERGLNPMVIQAITGHKTVQMLKRYTHLQTESLVAAVRRPRQG